MHATFLLLYLGALLLLGAKKARGVRSQEDFSLAGRGLSGLVLTGTLLATWIGTGSIFGNAQKGYEDGLAALILPLSSAVGIAVLWLLAARIRRMQHFTIQDILEERFGVATRIAGTLALLAGYLVLQQVMPDVGHGGAVVLVAVFVILYTALAGLLSVAYTDVANGLLMLLGLALCFPLVLMKAGGPAAVFDSLPTGPAVNREVLGYSSAKIVSYLLPPFLLILGDANMYQRFFAAREPRTARRAAAGMFFGVLLLDWLIIGIAVCGFALVQQGRLEAPENPAHIIVHLAFTSLPTWLGALLSATVVAVVVSTADSYLLSPATSLVRDLYQRFLRPGASGPQVVRVSRILVVLLGLVALGLAFTSDKFFEVALFAYTLYGAAITPPLLAALFWPRATGAGALASMVVGLVAATGWELGGGAALRELATSAGARGLAEFLGYLDAALPAVCLSVATLVLVSLLTRPAQPEGAKI